MQGAWVQSLVRGLRSHMLYGTAKKLKKKQNPKNPVNLKLVVYVFISDS